MKLYLIIFAIWMLSVFLVQQKLSACEKTGPGKKVSKAKICTKAPAKPKIARKAAAVAAEVQPDFMLGGSIFRF